MPVAFLFASFVSALADPGRIAATLDDAAGPSLDIVAMAPGAPLAGVLGSDSTLRVVDLETWDTTLVSLCEGGSAAGLAALYDDSAGTATFYNGCDDGLVELTTVASDGTIEHGVGASGVSGAVLALVVDDSALWAVYSGESNAEVSEIDLDTLEPGSVSGALSRSSCEGAVLINGLVLVAHGDDDVSRFDTTTGNASLSGENLAGRDFVDIELGGTSSVFLVDYSGALIKYNLTGSNEDNYQILLDEGNGLVAPSAVVVDADGEWLAIADTQVGNLIFYGFDTSSGSPNDEIDRVIDLGDTSKVSDIQQYEDYLLAATDDGELMVITQLPWVSVLEAPTETLTTGDSFSLSFLADMDADWEVRLFDADASAYATGSFASNESASVDVIVYDSWAEGRNRIYLTAESGGLVGRTAVDVIVDNPPDRIDDLSVGIGDQKLIVRFSGLEAADLATYEVYLSTVPFSADDYESGGPEYSGPDSDIESPISYTIEDPSADFEATIDGLTNDVVYYVGVRAVDDGGTEGVMSNVVSATPKLTTGAAGLAGEVGGLGCNSTGGMAGFSALVALLLLTRRRAPLVILLGLGLMPGLAHAADAAAGEVKGHKSSDGKLHLDRDTEVRVGQTMITSSEMQQVYGTEGLFRLDVEGGVQLLRVIELDAGLGLVRKEGTQVVVDSLEASDDITKLTLLPLSLSATARLDLFDGQPIVPYGSFGLDYYLWRERLGELSTDTMFDIDHVGGDKLGYHYALGANILLDWMEPDRADAVAARWGIHDSYLTVDWRRNEMLESGLSFGGSTITVGVKVDR